MSDNPYPLEQAPQPEGKASIDLLTMDACMSDMITDLGAERNASFGDAIVGRELSLSITNLEDAQSRLRKAIAAREARKAQVVRE